jgi:hypothetical protein
MMLAVIRYPGLAADEAVHLEAAVAAMSVLEPATSAKLSQKEWGVQF